MPTFQPYLYHLISTRLHQLLSPPPRRAAPLPLRSSCHEFWTVFHFPHDAVSLALLPHSTTAITHSANTTGTPSTTSAHTTNIPSSTTSTTSSTTSNTSSSTTASSSSTTNGITLWTSLYVDPRTFPSPTSDTATGHTSSTSISSILHRSTTTTFTICPPHHSYRNAATSHTSTGHSSLHISRTPMAHTARGMATLFSLPTSDTAVTTPFITAPTGNQHKNNHHPKILIPQTLYSQPHDCSYCLTTLSITSHYTGATDHGEPGPRRRGSNSYSFTSAAIISSTTHYSAPPPPGPPQDRSSQTRSPPASPSTHTPTALQDHQTQKFLQATPLALHIHLLILFHTLTQSLQTTS